MFESWIVLCVSGVLFGVAERVPDLAAIAGMQIGRWLKLPMLAIWSPSLAGMLFAAVLTMPAACLLRLGSRQPLASNLAGALNLMVAGTANLLPGVPLERAAIVSDTQDVLSGLLSRGPWWALGLMLAFIVFGAVSFAQGCLLVPARFPVASEVVLLSVLLGGTARLWPWQAVSAYTLTSARALGNQLETRCAE